jgi:orotidine-5'-phosphate decarboxylase
MVAAAIEGAGAAGSGTLVAAVTVLTSLDAAELGSLGVAADLAGQVLRLATLAVGAGAQALVCSPQEVAAVRAEVGPGVLLVTPGIRPAGGDLGDQSRVATPAAAVAAGADYLVVGRPITAATDPRAAAEAIRAEMGV